MQGRGPMGSRSNYDGPPAPEDVPGYRAPGAGPIPGEGRMARGSRLAEEAFAVIRSDRGLLGLALSATVLDFAILGAFFGGASALAGSDHRRLILVGAMCAASYPVTVVGTFFNVALLNTIARRWAGEQATGRSLRVGGAPGRLRARRRMGRGDVLRDPRAGGRRRRPARGGEALDAHHSRSLGGVGDGDRGDRRRDQPAGNPRHADGPRRL
jgi:hypothetical protein